MIREGQTDIRPKCLECKRVIAYRVTAPWEIKCSKCGAVYERRPVDNVWRKVARIPQTV